MKVKNRRESRKDELDIEKEIEKATRVVDARDQDDQARALAALRLRYVKNLRKGPIFDRLHTEQAILETAQLHSNTRKAVLSNNLSRSQKREVKITLIEGVSDLAAKDILGCKEQWVQKLRRLSKKDVEREWNVDGPEVTGEETPGLSQDGQLSVLISEMYVSFMRRHTGVMSGSNSDTLTLPIAKHTLMSKLFGEFPGMLRELVKSNPGVLSLMTDGTRLHMATTEAISTGAEIGFNATKEVECRNRMADSLYRQELNKKRSTTCRIKPADVKPKTAQDTFTPEEISKQNQIKPVGDTAFWNILKCAMIKFTTNLKPTLCGLCDSGATYIKSLNESTERQYSMMEKQSSILNQVKIQRREPSIDENALIKDLENQIMENLKIHRRLEALVSKYRIHRDQFEKCRDTVLKIENELKVGECLLYRDFVSQYCANGSKMSNLQLVCVYRNVNGGALRQIQVSNFSLKESNDKFYVADVMDLHLRADGSNLFKNFHKITITGDHGTHFSDIGTIYNESCMHEKYGKEVHIVSLCSYHCYNRCDAAGVHSKKLALAAAKDSKPLTTSQHYTQAVIDDKRTDTVAYNFEGINRSKEVFGQNFLHSPVILRELCEFSFKFDDKDGKATRIPGIIQCRSVPFVGKYLIVDLIRTRQGSWCQRCTQWFQRPVEHKSTEELCELEVSRGDNYADPVINLNATQDPGRINGLQLTQKIVAMLKAGTVFEKNTKVVPCLFCKNMYASGQNANTHMEKCHPTQYVESEHAVGLTDATKSESSASGMNVKKKRKIATSVPSFSNVQCSDHSEDVEKMKGLKSTATSNKLLTHGRKCPCSELVGSPYSNIMWRLLSTETTIVCCDQDVWVIDFDDTEGTLGGKCLLQVSKGRVNTKRSSNKNKVAGTLVTFKTRDGSVSDFWYAYSDMHTTYASAKEWIILAKEAILKTNNKEYIDHCLIKE